MGISIPQLLIILLIVALLFGTKKLRGIGSDLGSALKGFRSAIKDDNTDSDTQAADGEQQNIIEDFPEESEQPAQKKEEQV